MTEEDKSITLLSPGFSTAAFIFEQTRNGFAVWNRQTRRLESVDQDRVCLSDMQYCPLPRIPWPIMDIKKEDREVSEHLPETKQELLEKLQEANDPKISEATQWDASQELEEDLQLFRDIRHYFTEHLDIRFEGFFDVYSCFVLASWRTEDFTVVPYQFFLGPLASGKTRALECFHRLCYRSIMASSLTAASLFRVLEAYHATVILDETEIYNRENMVEVLALLNSGYRKGQYAIRIEKIEQGCPQIAFFDTFGLKVLAGTEELAATLQSRCILTTMSKAVRHVNLFVDEETAQELRNRLLMYRFRSLGKLNDFDVSKLNGYFNNARVIELFVSLLQVAPTEEIRNRLITCMKQITQSRLDEEQASIEARVFDAVVKCENQVDNGKISTQSITDAFNVGLPEKEQSTSRFIGRKVTALGFEKCRLSGGTSGYFWDNKLVERLRARYYPPSPKTTSLTSQTSQTSLMMDKTAQTSPEPSEVSEVTPTVQVSELVEKTVKSEVSEESEVSEVSLEALVSQVKTLERLTGNYEDKCLGCGKKGRMDWQITFHNDTWALLCEDCGFKLSKRLNEA